MWMGGPFLPLEILQHNNTRSILNWKCPQLDEYQALVDTNKGGMADPHPPLLGKLKFFMVYFAF